MFLQYVRIYTRKHVEGLNCSNCGKFLDLSPMNLVISSVEDPTKNDNGMNSPYICCDWAQISLNHYSFVSKKDQCHNWFKQLSLVENKSQKSKPNGRSKSLEFW